MRVTVIGTGYVGLVTGTCLADAGHDVMCVDIDKEKVAKLRRGEAPIYEPGLTEVMQRAHKAGRLNFTTSLEDINDPEVIFFALPTPPNGDGSADLRYVLKAAGDVGKVLKNYTVLVNKSTVPVGTAQRVASEVSKNATVDFDVVSNPEFLREGFAMTDFMQPDRIVVGTSSERARGVMEEVYRPFAESGAKLIFMDEASSEMTKYAANSFLAMKISFMNEIANLSEKIGADVDMVREGIGTDERIGTRFLYAGIGYGGSCFPKDVMALQRTASREGYDFKILNAVMDVNRRQKKVLVDKILKHYGNKLEGKTFAMWGLAFKPDTDDIREAPALDIIEALLEHGANIRAYDQEATGNVKQVIGDKITYAESALDALDGADALLIVTEWKEFMSISLDEVAARLAEKVIFDGRNIYSVDELQSAGFTYYSIGRRDIVEAEADGSTETALAPEFTTETA
jgi:UDPglucose 6-dehydrogenase